MTPNTDNGLFPYLWDGIKWMLSGVGVIALGVWRSVRRKNNTRFSRIEERISEIDRSIITAPVDYVSRTTFQIHERETRDALAKLGDAGDAREVRILASIESQANRIHARIDELFKSGR